MKKLVSQKSAVMKKYCNKIFIPGEKLFLDKRDNTEFDLLTVNETSLEPPQDDTNSLNSPRNLALEATFINHNFSQQVIFI